MPGGARTVRLTESGGKLRTDVVSGRVGVKSRDALAATVAHMFRLGEDLSGFYAVVSADGDLSWCATGAGRMLRAPTVFEDVVKTICTTNTAWSGTRKMTNALVENLGAKAPGGRRAFPTAQAMAEVDVVRRQLGDPVGDDGAGEVDRLAASATEWKVSDASQGIRVSRTPGRGRP